TLPSMVASPRKSVSKACSVPNGEWEDHHLNRADVGVYGSRDKTHTTRACRPIVRNHSENSQAEAEEVLSVSPSSVTGEPDTDTALVRGNIDRGLEPAQENGFVAAPKHGL